MAEVYSFDCFKLSISSLDAVMKEISVAWDDVGKEILFVLSSHKMDHCDKLCDYGFLLSIIGEHKPPLKFTVYYYNCAVEL